MTSTLARLGEQVRRDLERLDYPRRDWMPTRTHPDGTPIHDVIIVGAGQGGLATAFGLRRERITGVLVVDQNREGRAGPWLDFARMPTLRTPKHVLGPDLGIVNLTVAAWYEAKYGEGSWQALSLLPRQDWAAYLNWYRETLDLPVRWDTRVGALRWDPELCAFEVPCHGEVRDERLWARRVVLATGIEGSGEWHVPALLSDALPRSHYAHTRWNIDFEQLRGKRVAVLGAGASAFDNAATALERGAAEVRLYFRREALVHVNPYRWAEFAGFLGHHAALPDADRYRFIRQILRMGQLPPADTYERAVRHQNFHLHPGSAWHAVEHSGDAIVLHTERGTHAADFVIAATGFVTDLAKRPELKRVQTHIARWADRYTPPAAERHPDLDRHPYLGPHFEFQERIPGSEPGLAYLYNYTFGGLLSLGFGGASISGMKYSIPRLVAGIAGSFFLEDRETHFESLCRFEEKEF